MLEVVTVTDTFEYIVTEVGHFSTIEPDEELILLKGVNFIV